MKTWNGELYTHAQVKADGFSIKCKRDGMLSLVKCFTRTYENLAEPMRHVATAQGLWKSDWFLEASAIHGELWVPGGQSSDVLRALKKHDQALRFDVFEVVGSGFKAMYDQAMFCMKHGLTFLPWDQASQSPEHDCKMLEKLNPHLKRLEGVVLRDGKGGVWKWKRERTIDLIVTGTQDGRGKYEGLIGSLVCATNDGVERANVSGFDDSIRALPPDRMEGMIVEVKYQCVGANGRLRHPRFVRFRPDKRASECGPEQDGEL